MKRLTGLLMLMILVFMGCSRQEETGAGYLFTCTLSGNPECLDPQYTSNENAEIVISNIMEGLVRLDRTGTILPAGAESYTVSQDSLTYSFTLRNDCYWYSSGMDEKDAKPVTSLDYVFAFRRLLDPGTKAPHAEDFLCLENAEEILSGKLKPEKIGVSAPDGRTVVFQLAYPDEDFLLRLTQSCAVPCNEDFFLSTKGRYGLDTDMILCNGAFCLTNWMYDAYGSGNFLSFRKNSTYYDADVVFPGTLQFTIMRSVQEANQDFADGNSDVILTDRLPERDLTAKQDNVITSYSHTWGLIFNPDNETLQNTAFREALACGIDREALSSQTSENLQPAYGIIPPAVQLLGRPYRELYADEPLSPAYQPEHSYELFQEISESVPMQIITSMKILVPSTFTDTEVLLSICQEWQSLFGHYIGIETVSLSEYHQRLHSGDYSIALYCITPPLNSCYSALNLFQDEHFGLKNRDFSVLMQTLSRSGNLTDKISLYGSAEKNIISQYAFIPLFYQCSYLIYTKNNADIWCNPFCQAVVFRDAKHFS